MHELVKKLEQRGYQVTCLNGKDEVKSYILSKIPSPSLIGIGGSMTVLETGLYEALGEKGHEVLWHWKVDPTDRPALLRKIFNADYYLTSTNAITQDGVLVNIDGTGNRVSAMIFGPKKVFMIVGKNKIVKNVHEGLNRIKSVTCPKNAARLDLKTPCGITGKCNNCHSMCKATTILDARPRPNMDEFEIILVNEDMGY